MGRREGRLNFVFTNWFGNHPVMREPNFKVRIAPLLHCISLMKWMNPWPIFSVHSGLASINPINPMAYPPSTPWPILH